MFETPEILGMLAAFGGILTFIYKLLVHFKNPKLNSLIDEKIEARSKLLDENSNRLSDLDHETKMELSKLTSSIIQHDNDIKKLESENKELASNIYKKIDNMHQEIIRIIRDQTKG